MIKVILLNRDKSERFDWNKPLLERGKLIFETEKDLDVYDILKKDNKFYSVSVKDHKNKVVGVDETEFELNPNATIEADFTCPYCKNVDYDGFEKNEGETYCGGCGSTVELELSNDYYIVKPVHPTSIRIIK